MFYDGFPFGYDYPIQINTYEAVQQQILNVDIYPRWLKDINQGFGGSNLFFYPPLIYYTYFALDCLTFFLLPTETVLCLGVWFILIMSGLSFYTYANQITSKNNSLTASALYITLPYHLLFEVYTRNAISEFYAYVWIPLIFLCLDQLIHKNRKYLVYLGILYCLLIISHLPTAVLCTIFILAYATIRAVLIQNLKQGCQYLMLVFWAFLLGIGLSSFYLYPAISLLEHMNISFLWNEQFNYKNWFLSPRTYQNCPETLSCLLLTTLLILQFTLSVFLLVFFILFQKSYEAQIVTFFLLTAFCAFMMTPYSLLIWDNIQPLQKVQFPWRLFVIYDFLLISLLTHVYRDIKLSISFRKKTFSNILFIFHTVLILTGLVFVKDIHNTLIVPNYSERFKQQLDTKTVTLEHMSNSPNFTVSFYDFLKTKHIPLLSVKEGNATIDLIQHKPRLISIDVTAHSETTIQIRQFQFIGWRIKNSETGMDLSDKFNLRDAKPFGEIEFDVPEGKHSLLITLETMPQEKIGMCISMISLFILFTLIFMATYTETGKEPIKV